MLFPANPSYTIQPFPLLLKLEEHSRRSRAAPIYSGILNERNESRISVRFYGLPGIALEGTKIFAKTPEAAPVALHLIYFPNCGIINKFLKKS